MDVKNIREVRELVSSAEAAEHGLQSGGVEYDVNDVEKHQVWHLLDQG